MSRVTIQSRSTIISTAAPAIDGPLIIKATKLIHIEGKYFQSKSAADAV